MIHFKHVLFAMLVSIFLFGCSKSPIKDELDVVNDIKDSGNLSEPSIRDTDFDATNSLNTIYFEYDQASLSDSARNILGNNADWLKENNKGVVLVEGHTDERGTTEYNLALGQKRATAVRNYLIYLGIEADRIATISYGEEKPALSGFGESVWVKNRRVEFVCSRIANQEVIKK
ncbi:MAG: peptidoglycan-associated lipoprotein Pal [Elusimicrobiota bacterium]